MDSPEPTYGFATAADGTRIALSRNGNGPPLVFVRGWISQLDIFWADDDYRRFFQKLGNHFTVYRFDCRGNGLSDRHTGNFSWPALVSDLEAVIKHESLSDFVLWGSTFGAIVAVHYAAANPDRVASLVLDGAFDRGKAITSRIRRVLLVQSLRRFPEMAISLLANATRPSPNFAHYRRPEVVQRMIAPATAAKLYGAAFKADIRKLLPRLEMPTLVLHRRNSQSIPFHLGSNVSKGIPGARFVPLEGTAHNIWEEDPATALHAILDFLRPATAAEAEEAGDPATLDPRRKLAAVLHADVVGYTDKMEHDETGTYQRLLHRITLLRQCVARYNGVVHHEAGDAALAEFGSASAAVICAVAFQRQAAERNATVPDGERIDFRVGIHVGEVMGDRGTLYGTGVNMAERLQGIAPAGGICVSKAVRDAVYQILPYAFVDLGDRRLKNLSFPIPAYLVREDASGLDAAAGPQDIEDGSRRSG